MTAPPEQGTITVHGVTWDDPDAVALRAAMRAAPRYADRMAALPAHDVTTALGVDAVRALGSTRIILQTDDRQPDAVRLYECEGYTRIPVFPPYEWLSFSICMEKVLR